MLRWTCGFRQHLSVTPQLLPDQMWQVKIHLIRKGDSDWHRRPTQHKCILLTTATTTQPAIKSNYATRVNQADWIKGISLSEPWNDTVLIWLLCSYTIAPFILRKRYCDCYTECIFHMFVKGELLLQVLQVSSWSTLSLVWPESHVCSSKRKLAHTLDCFWDAIMLSSRSGMMTECAPPTLNRMITGLITIIITLLSAFFLPLLLFLCCLSFLLSNATDGSPGMFLGEGPIVF